MANKLFEGNDRDESHRKLAELIVKYPLAECREDRGSNVYTVWDGSEIKPNQPVARNEVSLDGVNIRFTDEEMDDLAARIAKKMKGEG